ncbi:MAG: multicopper oxidase family protein [Chloroflexi bacterium]|nr:MAG: multicopper oxidase family protein [Chloroflexota bacterium]
MTGETTMHTQMRWHMLRLAALILVVAMAVGFGPVDMSSVALTAPATPTATTLPATTCTLVGTTRACDLWATTGTLALPGGVTVPIWGYTDVVTGTAQLPGPPLIVNQGETVQVTLHNTLNEASSLAFLGQNLIPDTVGAAPLTGTAIYTFTATSPGTYLYEAGLTPNAAHQVAMGLFGALIVRPTTNPLTQAYNETATAFDDEALVVLSEIDPDLNNSADPASFDMRLFAPRYWLINGKAYPDTDPIPTAAGNTVLLRYINAGLEHHSMGLLGLDQTVLSTDGSEFTYSHGMVAETLAPGQTADVLTTIPATPPAGTTKYALYNTNMLLHNNGQFVTPGGPIAFGGMLTFLTISGGTPPAIGPATTNVALTPNPTNGSVDVALSAQIDGGSAITAAEYFLVPPGGTPGAGGTGQSMTATDGAFDTASEAVNSTILASTLAAYVSGKYTIYVHGQDAAGWGPFSFAILNLDKLGPATLGVRVTPDPTNGAVGAVLRASGDDSATGNGNVVAAEYFIDVAGANGTGTGMMLNHVAPAVSLTAIIPASTVNGLAEGVHTIYVHSQDAAGNWGDLASTTLTVDKSGPTTTGVSVVPSPNNGTLRVSPTTPAVRVDATIDDPLSGGVNSEVVAAEGFIDTVGAPGTGFPLIPSDGAFDSAHESGYALIALSTIELLTEGPHAIYIRGKDTARNWGTPVATMLTIDKSGPTISNVSVWPTQAGDSDYVFLTATAVDHGLVSNIVAAEWFDGADPGVGLGTAMAANDNAFDSPSEDLKATINVNGWPAGAHVLSVRAKDAAGNWSTVGTTTLTVQPYDGIFGDGFESQSFSAWSLVVSKPPPAPGDPLRLRVTGAAALVGNWGMEVTLNGEMKAYVQDNTPAGEPSYHARFWFHPNGTVTGGTKHDIFIGRDVTGKKIFRVQYRQTNNGLYQIRAAVQRIGGQRKTAWYTITNAPHAIEIAWQSGTNVSFSLYVDGTLRRTLAGLDTSRYLVDTVQLGPAGGVSNKVVGTEYFDAFASTRNSYIGP